LRISSSNVVAELSAPADGHTSQIMERYKHLDSSFANQPVERIGGMISKQIATNSATPHVTTSKTLMASRREANSVAFTAF
jgi:hypothetical protein